jgi:hypothetical protein
MPSLPDCGLIVRGKVIATARIRLCLGVLPEFLMPL